MKPEPSVVSVSPDGVALATLAKTRAFADAEAGILHLVMLVERCRKGFEGTINQPERIPVLGCSVLIYPSRDD